LEHANRRAENPGDDFVDRTRRNPTFLEGVTLVGDFNGLKGVADLFNANRYSFLDHGRADEEVWNLEKGIHDGETDNGKQEKLGYLCQRQSLQQQKGLCEESTPP
jgi:hypothetical protein